MSLIHKNIYVRVLIFNSKGHREIGALNPILTEGSFEYLNIHFKVEPHYQNCNV